MRFLFREYQAAFVILTRRFSMTRPRRSVHHEAAAFCPQAEPDAVGSPLGTPRAERAVGPPNQPGAELSSLNGIVCFNYHALSRLHKNFPYLNENKDFWGTGRGYSFPF